MLLRLVGAGRLRRTAPRVSLPPASWDQRATGGRGRNISAVCKGTGQNKRLKVEVNLYSESPFSSFPLAWGTPLLCCDNLSNLFSTVKADKLGDSFTMFGKISSGNFLKIYNAPKCRSCQCDLKACQVEQEKGVLQFSTPSNIYHVCYFPRMCKRGCSLPLLICVSYNTVDRIDIIFLSRLLLLGFKCSND